MRGTPLRGYDPMKTLIVVGDALFPGNTHTILETKVMNAFQLERLGQIMEPEPGNPLEARRRFHGSSRGNYSASALPAFASTMPGIPRASSGSALRSSRKRTTSRDGTVAAVARIRAAPSWSRSSGT